MSGAASIRALDRPDLDELIDLCREHAAYEQAAFVERDDHAAALCELLLEAPDAHAWVALGEGQLAGFATAFEERSTWNAGRFLHLDCLYLRPAYRGRGLGAQLMDRARDAARRRGLAQLQWQTPAWNTGAVRFYERLGARAVDKLRFSLDLPASSSGPGL